MKSFLRFLILILSINAYSQFNYQSLIRDTNGNIVVNTDIQIRFGIIYDSPTATPIYSEIHQITTPSDGVINILIGDGVAQTGSSSFTSIDWSKIVYIKQEVEIDNSGSFIDFGTNKLNSVPIAEFAKKTTISTDDLSNLVLGGTNLSNSVNTSGNDGRNNYVFSDNGMQSNTTGDRNIAIGNGVLVNNTIGRYNVAIGNDALQQNVSGYGNVAIGLNAMLSANKRNNTAIGFYSMVNINSDANTAVGSEALKGSTTVSNNTGIANTAVGYLSMFSNSSGDNNNAFGNVTLEDNTTGRANSAFGSESLRENIDGNYNAGFGNGTLWKNTSGSNNTAVGYQSSSSNTTGVGNTSMGQGSLFSNSIGSHNVAIGRSALKNNVAGNGSVAIGYQAMMYANDSASSFETSNTAIGYEALRGSSTSSSNTGNQNTAIGHQSLINNTSGLANTAIGVLALRDNASGDANTAIGRYALISNTSGNYNIGIGDGALYSNSTDSNNTSVGYQSLYNSTGNGNTALGQGTGSNLNTGSNNTFLGKGADTSSGSLSNSSAIGANAIVTTNNTIQLGDNNVTLVNTYGTVSATAFVGDGSGLTNLSTSGPIYKSSIVEQSSLTAAADSQIDLPGMSFRWNSGKLEIKSEAGNSPQAMTFYFSYHTNSGDTVNFRPDSVSFNSNTWSPVDCSWCSSGSPNIPSITGSYAVYEFDFTVYPLNDSGNHYGRTYNVKIFLGGWLGVHMRAFYQ